MRLRNGFVGWAVGLLSLGAALSGVVNANGAMALKAQKVTFAIAPAKPLVGHSGTVSATAGSHLQVAFTVDPASTGGCSLSDATYDEATGLTSETVNYSAPGLCTIDANQAGDGTQWAVAPQKQQTLKIKLNPQKITFAIAPAKPLVGQSGTVSATAGSHLQVGFSISDSSTGECSLSKVIYDEATGLTSATVTYSATGSCTIDANQSGDGTHWAPAPQKHQSLRIRPSGGGGSGTTIASFSASPTSLSDEGGSVTLDATVTGASDCTFSSSPAIVDLPTTVSCSGGSATESVTLPPNSGSDPVTYTFTLTAMGTSSATATASVTVEPAPAPTLLDAEYNTNGIKLTFSAPPIGPDETITDYYYYVSCDGGANFQGPEDAHETSSPFIATTACVGAQYKIAAYINGSWTTPPSNVVTVKPLNEPTLSDAEYNTNGIKLTFSAPPIGPDETITDYYYYVSCDGGANFQGPEDAHETSSPFIATTACVGAQYKIAAYINGSWMTPPSNVVTVKPLNEPTLSDAEYNTNGIKLTFSAPPIGPDETITDYYYYVSCDGGANFQGPEDAHETSSPFIATTACVGAQYKIAAYINGSWMTPPSNVVTVDPLTAATLDSATYEPNVGGGAGLLSVTPPALGPDETVTDYYYEISCDGGDYQSLDDAYASTSPLQVGWCGYSMTSSYRVYAYINGTWLTPVSNAASFVGPPPPPPPSQ